MKRIEYKTADKSTWGEGPWQDEPDKVQWLDSNTGYPCLIVRASVTGAWCGYVGVSANHPFHGKDYADAGNLDVHGGLSFASSCSPGPEEQAICHKVEPSESDDVWWLGFDCAHAFDTAPAMAARYRERAVTNPLFDVSEFDLKAVYRDTAYVTAECEKLAKQLKKMEK